jgi:hypothetical protein
MFVPIDVMSVKEAYEHGREVAANEIERLRAALESIAKNTCCDRCQEAALVAKAALRETV